MMHAMQCEQVQDHLESFHDEELALDQQVAVQSHLRDCVTCALAAAELDEIRQSLRGISSGLPDRTADDAERMHSAVVERLRVEELFSVRAQFRSMFQDWHLVWAALGATAAMVVCIMGSASVMYAASQERPDSLAGIIAFLANPGSNANPVRLDTAMMAPRSMSEGEGFLPMSHLDAVLAMSAVVTREGRVQNLELLADQARVMKVRPEVLLAMFEAASRTQFEPALARSGNAVAVSMVWVLASMTVRGEAEDVVLVRRPTWVAPIVVPAADAKVPVAVVPTEVATKPSPDTLQAV